MPGAYKENILGQIIDGKIKLNVLGKITVREWLKTFQIRKNIQLDEYVIMPNHFHGIIILTEKEGHNSLCPYKNNQKPYNYRDTMNRTLANESFGKPIPGSIPTIVRMFKSAVTREIKRLDYPFFYSIWQRNYYEHIIPLRWQYDKENQEGKPDDREKNFWKNFT
jgi:REP element-mobilizing transposase RayT